uniref:Uncharacterized protein n=1 Tax=Oryza meridionalis TaxID=40149 RepID=A0A0E0CJV5_9ORYZ
MAAMLLRLHPCPLLFPPPPPHPHLRRQLAVYSIPKSSFRSAAAAARARNPPRLAAVGGAERRRVGDDYDEEEEDLGQALERTRQLVECAMFASVAGLAYFLSNSLAIENYFSCFFPLPIVISSLRWGLEAGRKTALMHGVVGLAMGTMWRLETNWIVSIILCSIITVNIHASLTYILAAAGVNTIPSMDAIYVLFGTLLLLNCGFFIFLLHIMYTIFLTKLGIKPSLRPPRWLDKAI